MADEEHQKHQATMRIDITPAMLEQLQQAPVPGAARISSRPGGCTRARARADRG